MTGIVELGIGEEFVVGKEIDDCESLSGGLINKRGKRNEGML